MPNLTEELRVWDGVSEPTEEMYALLVADLRQNRADKTIGKVASRVNQELAGTRSLFTSTARKAKNLEPPYKDSVIKAKKKWGEHQGLAGHEADEPEPDARISMRRRSTPTRRSMAAS